MDLAKGTIMTAPLAAPPRIKNSWQTSRRWKHLVLWTISALTVIVIILYALQAFVGFVDEMVFPGSQYTYHDSSPKPVILRLGDGRVSIARDYVETYFPPSGKDVGSLMIAAFLPDFVPERVYAVNHPNPAIDTWIPPDIKQYDKALTQAVISSPTPTRPDLAAQASLDRQFKDEEQYYAFDFSELIDFDEWVNQYGEKLFAHRGTDHYWIDCANDCTIVYLYRGTFTIDLSIDTANLGHAEQIKQNFNKFLDTQMKILN